MSKHKHNYNKIAQLLLVGLMSTTLYNTSFAATKEIKLAEPPAYQSAWAKEGCSQDAWNQLSEEYKTKNNEFEAINKVIGQNHREEFSRTLLPPGPYYLKLRIYQPSYASSFTINLSTRLYFY